MAAVAAHLINAVRQWLAPIVNPWKKPHPMLLRPKGMNFIGVQVVVAVGGKGPSVMVVSRYETRATPKATGNMVRILEPQIRQQRVRQSRWNHADQMDSLGSQVPTHRD